MGHGKIPADRQGIKEKDEYRSLRFETEVLDMDKAVNSILELTDGFIKGGEKGRREPA